MLDESCRETGEARDMPPPQVRLAGEKGDCDEDPRILLEFIEGGMLKGGR